MRSQSVSRSVPLTLNRRHGPDRGHRRAESFVLLPRAGCTSTLSLASDQEELPATAAVIDKEARWPIQKLLWPRAWVALIPRNYKKRSLGRSKTGCKSSWIGCSMPVDDR